MGYRSKILLLIYVLINGVVEAQTVSTGWDMQKSASAYFRENKGQVSDQDYNPRTDVLYCGEVNGMVYHLRNNGISYQLYRVDKWSDADKNSILSRKETGLKMPEQITIYRVDVNWPGSNPDFIIEKDNPLNGSDNYFTSTHPDGITNIKTYSGVTFKNLYDGIDLHYYDHNGTLKYDYLVQSYSDYKKIQLDVAGAEKITAQKDGSVIIQTPLGMISEDAPVAYQQGMELKTHWIVHNNSLSFEVENYSDQFPLIIDPPTRVWGTYYGTAGIDFSYSCSTDAAGNVFLSGTVGGGSVNIATTGAHQTTFNGTNDAFLAKFDANGVRQWGTYYGGTGTDYGLVSSIDPSGNIYLGGYTASSTAIATAGSHQSIYGGGTNDAFIVKFNTNGTRLWSTYYGGTASDEAYGCATDASGNVYLTGRTASSNAIATAGAHQATFGGGSYDVFIVKFTANGTRVWGTYYGGTGSTDYTQACTVDPSGNLYVAGPTNSTTKIATAGAYQSVFGGGADDAFLVKFDGNGNRLWGTYYGSTGSEWARSCAADISGNIYIGGHTSSTATMATAGSHQSTYGGGSSDAFLVKFNTNGARIWATYYGGTGDDYGFPCATDASGNVYITGQLNSTNGIATAGAYQATFGGGTNDAFLVEFDANGIRQWGTYYGGPSSDLGLYCALDASGNIFMSGHTTSSSAIATAGSQQSSIAGSNDAFLVKFSPVIPLPVDFVEFSASCNQHTTLLVWSTVSETNNSFFEIEKSGNGHHFENAGQVKGAGTSSILHHYLYEIDQAGQEIYYYRIRQVDFNGEFTYSKTIAVRCNPANQLSFQVSPNPSSGTIYVIPSDEKVLLSNPRLSITDLSGRIILQETLLKTNTIIDIKNKCAQGAYFVRIQNEEGDLIYNRKLIFQQ